VCWNIYGIKIFILGCRKRVLRCIKVQEEFVVRLCQESADSSDKGQIGARVGNEEKGVFDF